VFTVDVNSLSRVDDVIRRALAAVDSGNVRGYRLIMGQEESRANAGVSARQRRHLASNCEFGFLNSDSNV